MGAPEYTAILTLDDRLIREEAGNRNAMTAEVVNNNTLNDVMITIKSLLVNLCY